MVYHFIHCIVQLLYMKRDDGPYCWFIITIQLGPVKRFVRKKSFLTMLFQLLLHLTLALLTYVRGFSG